MRAKELCTLDNLPDEVLQQLGANANALATLGSAKPLEHFTQQPSVTGSPAALPLTE
jgi:hypothetical protein